MHKAIFAAAIALGALATSALTGCSGSNQVASGSAAQSEALQVQASCYPLYFIAENVVGNLGEVTNLTQSGGEPHDLELSIAQVQAMLEADLVLYLGNNFQSSVEEAVSSTGVAALDAMSVVPESEVRSGDSHMWLNPEYMVNFTAEFAEQLAAINPENAAEIQANAEALQDELEQLDADFAAGLAEMQGATMVVTHEAFGYLAAAYQLQQLGIRGVNPEEEPSTSNLLEVADQAAAAGATTLFYDQAEDSSTATTYADLLNLQLAAINTLEVQPESGDYLSVMRENLDALQAHLAN